MKNIKEKEYVCNRCGGTGNLKIFLYLKRGPVPEDKKFPDHYFPVGCERCKSTGKVDWIYKCSS